MIKSSSSPPGPHLLLLEARAIAELATALWISPLLRLAPTGDGHPVLVLPGLLASDRSTWLLRAFLRQRGYRAHGWKLGSNTGQQGLENPLKARLAQLADRHQRKVSIIGWSLGGIYARQLAFEIPEFVRSVITLGSPFTGDPKASNAWQLYEMTSGRAAIEGNPMMRETAPPVPSTAIYSRSDGIVAWQCCIEREGPHSESIEVESSHGGMGHHPAVLYAIADRLSQPDGQWRPFQIDGLRGFFFRSAPKAAAI